MRIVIIGGSDAGISAALRARELDPGAEVAVLLADEFPNWSVCGLPFYLSGETPDWRSLAHRTEFPGIEVLRGHRVEAIDAGARSVRAIAASGAVTLDYDQAIVATGGVPMRPQMPGIDLPGVHLLHTMGDALAVHRDLDQRSVRSAVIIGAGYIGIEMADALTHRGLKVTLLSRSDPVFPTIDPVFGRLVDEELRAHGVAVASGRVAEAITGGDNGRLVVGAAGDWHAEADMVIVAAGVRPAGHLAIAAGALAGVAGAISVDRRMRTGVPGLLAAGDCVETWHRLLQRPVYLPLGTTAHKQGRVAGETAVGGTSEFAGSVGTQTVKIFSLAVARTGLLQREAEQYGFDAFTTETAAWDHKAYYPGARRLRLRVTGCRVSGRLLGAQILGDHRSEISKRMDVFATALFHGMSVEALSDLDLSYTPPFSSPWDPIQVAAQDWAAALRHHGK